MQVLIDVFRMVEVSVDTRKKLLLQLCKAINYQYASNVCNELVDELILLLDKNTRTPDPAAVLREVREEINKAQRSEHIVGQVGIDRRSAIEIIDAKLKELEV